MPEEPGTLAALAELERKILWLATWTIHNANHLRESADGLKVGGHQASSASIATIMTALYLHALRPEDRVAVKPHASPIFHAIQYLLGNQTLDKLQRFRGLGGAQSYPSRTKDGDDVDFSTGSVGLGVAQTLFSSLVQDYLRVKGWGTARPEGRMVALIGDAEMDEGNIFEALLEGWKHGLRNTWWVVDYNRQSLDAVIREGLWAKFEAMFRNFGWDVVVLRHGGRQEAAFREPGGERLRAWIEGCPNQLYSALTFGGGAAWRKRLEDELGDQGEMTALLDRRTDDELADLMGNLGGHDLPSLLEAFEAARTHDRPVCFICYTIKGFGLPLAGHKDNHAGLMNPAQVERLRAAMAVRPGREWDRFEGLELPPDTLEAFLAAVPFNARGRRRYHAPRIPVPDALAVPPGREMSTQHGFGLLMHELAKGDTPLAERIVTTSPDVTVSTNLGAWVNRRGLFARENMADTFKAERIPSTFHWSFSPKGQHVELGIAEMNLFTMLFGPRTGAFAPWRAAVADRDALRPVHRARPRCVELRLLPGRALHPGRDAVRHQPGRGRGRPPVDRDTADRHGAGRAPELRARVRGRVGGHPALGLGLHPATCRVRARRGRLGLPAPLDPVAGSTGEAARARRSGGRRRRRLLDPAAGPQRRGGRRLQRRGGAGGGRGGRAYRGGPARRGAARGDLGGSAARRLGCVRRDVPHRPAARPPAPALRPGDGAGRTPRGACLARLGARPSQQRALGVTRFGQTGTIGDLHRVAGIDAQSILAAAQSVAPGRPMRHLRAV